MNKLDAEASWQRAINYLLRHKQDAWWPYKPGQGPSAEATAWAALALSEPTLSDNFSLVSKSYDWLISMQNDDGGWSTSPQAKPSDWTSGPVFLSLRKFAEKSSDKSPMAPHLAKSLRAGKDYLIQHRLEKWTPLGQVVMFLFQGPDYSHYPRGWPWVPASYHWVEPTSYSLMALKPLRLSQSEPLKTVVAEADKYLLEIACVGGGWNYGENIRLDEKLPSYQLDTAEALVAIQNHIDNQKVQSALNILRKLAGISTAPMTLAWSIMARRIFGDVVTEDLKTLLDHQDPDGGFAANIHTTALASLAIATTYGAHPLKYTDHLLDLS